MKEINQWVQEAAESLCDTKLLAKLSKGDIVPIEARYPKSCLGSMYNRVRSEEAKKIPKDQEDDIVYGVVA